SPRIAASRTPFAAWHSQPATARQGSHRPPESCGAKEKGRQSSSEITLLEAEGPAPQPGTGAQGSLRGGDEDCPTPSCAAAPSHFVNPPQACCRPVRDA